MPRSVGAAHLSPRPGARHAAYGDPAGVVPQVLFCVNTVDGVRRSASPPHRRFSWRLARTSVSVLPSEPPRSIARSSQTCRSRSANRFTTMSRVRKWLVVGQQVAGALPEDVSTLRIAVTASSTWMACRPMKCGTRRSPPVVLQFVTSAISASVSLAGAPLPRWRRVGGGALCRSGSSGRALRSPRRRGCSRAGALGCRRPIPPRHGPARARAGPSASAS